MVLISFLLMISGFLGVVIKHKHLMNMIIGLEFMGLSLICVLIMVLGAYLGDVFLLLVLFTFIACEGALGISIIVSLIRSHGDDYFFNFNVLKC